MGNTSAATSTTFVRFCTAITKYGPDRATTTTTTTTSATTTGKHNNQPTQHCWNIHSHFLSTNITIYCWSCAYRHGGAPSCLYGASHLQLCGYAASSSQQRSKNAHG